MTDELMKQEILKELREFQMKTLILIIEKSMLEKSLAIPSGKEELVEGTAVEVSDMLILYTLKMFNLLKKLK